MTKMSSFTAEEIPRGKIASSKGFGYGIRDLSGIV